ncbi:MAG: GspE/PulE family protein [Hyphomicrobiales bacterium]
MQEFLESLSDRGLITPQQLSRLVKSAAEDGGTAVKAISRLGYLDQQVLVSELSRYFRIPVLDDKEWPKAQVLPDRISARFMREHHVLPLRADAQRVTVAVADPADAAVRAAIEVACERPVELRLAPEGQIVSRIEKLLDGVSGGAAPEGAIGVAGAEDEEHLKDMALDAPVIDLVNRLFREASAARATDLHIEPARGRVVVRRRVDGMLMEAGVLPPDIGKAAVSRIKILTQLNIAERRLPQDGRARVRIGGREYDIRVATMPTIHGESIAIRFLSATTQVPEIGQLGLTQRDMRILKEQASFSHGLIVVTGPTGSGKTTTLAAVLSFLNDPSRKILTIEDPVEYQVEGVNQIQVRPDIGLSFASTLRSLLRLDPDIIMVGEMRDAETARIGVNAALTGHLVLTTLHTNSAAAAVTRLLDLELQAYLIASTLRCAVAQRLVRRLCGNCRQEYHGFPDALAAVAADAGLARGAKMKLWKAVGCDHCGGTGYHGRAAIFEILVVDEAMRRLIRPDVDADVIAKAAKSAGMIPLIADGLAKCRQGLTTIEELTRVALEA